ncbi:PREDICTED: protein EXORDIUM-like 2 [Fragaria vesca subsp. vesca]|uniref:protein EXORDIUM-like 2 n=1 Tax=Fragaria vesca subsp. vesca TaxID=101020 RepID=UPI0002C31EED|nr:PREDICTED: protein EXORDIUM-like 2 [Fragaria vesca subsp. vesca]
MSCIHHFAIPFFLFVFLLSSSALVEEQPLVLKYHNDPLLKGNITVNLIWYGHFTPTQRSIAVNFVHSLSRSPLLIPSASSWWKTTRKYKTGSSNLVVGTQVLHQAYTLSKSLNTSHLVALVGSWLIRPPGQATMCTG